MTCSNYYLIVLTWHLALIHPAIGLQDIWLPINYIYYSFLTKFRRICISLNHIIYSIIFLLVIVIIEANNFILYQIMADKQAFIIYDVLIISM